MASQIQKQNIRLLANTETPITMQEKELREQLHLEIENKSKSCSNPTFECSIPRIDGSYDFCVRHILRDPRSGYKQCSFIYLNGKKCINAVPKQDTKKDPALTTLCFEHSRQMQLNKTRNSVGKFKRVESNESFLNTLAPHLNVEDTVEKQKLCEFDEEIDVVSPNVPPFVNYDQIHDLRTITVAVKKRKRMLDYASDSSSEEDIPSMSNTAKTNEWNDSDNESVDSQEDDLLKHAGIYTRQEAIFISENKLTKLQGLYIDQINRLHHILKEKRRQYLHAIRKEREVLCSIHDQIKETPVERLLYEKLKAMSHYHRRYGVEAVLYKKFKEKRSRSIEGYSHKGPAFVKCIYTEGGVKCGERALPSCKYCRKHVLEDKKQILFRACEVEKSGVVCQETVPCIFDDSTCVLHLEMPTKRQYIQKKYESETEEDDAEGGTNSNLNADIKTEPDELVLALKDDNSCGVDKGATCSSNIQSTNDAGKNITISHDAAAAVAATSS